MRRITFSLLATLILVLSPNVFAEVSRSSEYRFLTPAPRSEDGRFTNFVGELLRGGTRVRFPFLMGRIRTLMFPREGTPERVESATRHFTNPTRLVSTNASTRPSTVTWIGHATVLVEMGGVRFLTDPIWSERASPISWAGPARQVEPGIALDDLPEIDFVLISHNHYDHLDIPTLEALSELNPQITFYVPLGNERLLEKHGLTNVRSLDWMQTLTHAGVEIHCLPSQHWSKRGLADDLENLWASWAVIASERRFFFAGDTGYFGGFAEIGNALGPFDLAAVPIGAYRPTELMRFTHMNPEEAVKAALAVRARRALAIHFGTFDLADEPLDEPPFRFRDEIERRVSDRLEPWIFDIGEIRPF